MGLKDVLVPFEVQVEVAGVAAEVDQAFQQLGVRAFLESGVIVIIDDADDALQSFIRRPFNLVLHSIGHFNLFINEIEKPFLSDVLWTVVTGIFPLPDDPFEIMPVVGEVGDHLFVAWVVQDWLNLDHVRVVLANQGVGQAERVSGKVVVVGAREGKVVRLFLNPFSDIHFFAFLVLFFAYFLIFLFLDVIMTSNLTLRPPISGSFSPKHPGIVA